VLAVLLGHGIAQAVATAAPSDARMLGAIGGGLLMVTADLAIRRKWGEGPAAPRYLLGSQGPGLGVVPAWAIGLGFVLIGFGLRD
jgi:hypothetical protein